MPSSPGSCGRLTGGCLGSSASFHQLKDSPVVLLTWLNAHQSCLPAKVWVMGVRKAGVVPVDQLASAGEIFNWTKCLHNQVVVYVPPARNARLW